MCCACRDTIVQAPAPSRLIERGIAGPGLLAHVLVAKFADHLPLYRQRAAASVGRRDPQTRTGAPNCMPTTRRYRCSRLATARQKLAGCGPMCATTGLRRIR